MNMIPTSVPREKTPQDLIVDHIAKTAVGARLVDIAAAVDHLPQHQLAQIETEMRMARQGQPMHTFDYDACEGR